MDKSISDSQRLLSLDKQQALIVYLIRHGSNNREIGRVLGGGDPKDALAPSTIADYMRPIYKKLDIQIEKLSEKRNEITIRYGKLIDIYIPDESLLENWVAIPLPPELEEEEVKQKEGKMEPTADIGDTTTDIGEKPTDIGEAQPDIVDAGLEPVEEKEEKLAGEQTTTPQEEPGSTEGQPDSILGQVGQMEGKQGIDQRPPAPVLRPRILIPVGVVVLCLLCVGVGYLGLNFVVPWLDNAIAQIQQTQPPADTQEPTISQDVPTNPTTPSVEFTEPSTVGTQVVVSETSTPTEIPSPTNTFEPSSTPTSKPTPVPPLFEDTFDTGINPAWDMDGDNYGVIDQQLNSLGFFRAFVGDETWTNYIMEFEMPFLEWTELDKGIKFIVRNQDNSNYMSMNINTINSCTFEWYVVRNEEQKEIVGTKKKISNNWDACRGTWRIEVNGNTYKTFLNFEQVQSFINDEFTNGGVGIAVDRENTKFILDSFKVDQIP